MRKIFKLGSDGGDSGSKKYTRGYGDACSGVWQAALGGSLELGGRLCVVAFVMSLATFDMIILHLIYVIKKFYKFCTLYAVTKIML
jgi:hypothetical protein